MFYYINTTFCYIYNIIKNYNLTLFLLFLYYFSYQIFIMNLHEYQGKKILAEHGVNIQRGYVLFDKKNTLKQNYVFLRSKFSLF